MWQYEKKLQYPVNIKNPNPKLAEFIVSQLGGEVRGLLTDIGTEELAH